MGLLDKLKQVGSFFGDGGAEVRVRMDQQPHPIKEALRLHIDVLVKAKPLSVRKVYLKIKGEEKVRIPNVRRAVKMGDEIREREETISKSHQTFQTEVQVMGPQELEANQSYEWTAEYHLPTHLNPTYRGHFTEHVWSIYVGLDVPGNDPDSNWIPIEISS